MSINMNYQKYLIKIEHHLLAQLQWDHAEMFYVGNNVKIVKIFLKYYIIFYFFQS